MGAAIEHNLFVDYVFEIASGATKSSKVYRKGTGGTPTGIENPKLCLVGLITPAALTATAFTFEVSDDGVTYYPVYDQTGTAISIPVGTSRWTVIPPAISFGWGYIKLAAAGAEAGARQIIGRFQVV